MFKPINILIALLWAGFQAYWVIKYFGNKQTVRSLWWYRMASLLLAVYVAWAVLGFGKAPGEGSFVLHTAGFILCLSGLIFSIWARVHLGENWSAEITLKKDHALITTGPYAYVRHPIYTGLLIALTGTGLALTPSPKGAVFIAVVMGAFWIKMKKEENLMLKQFPEAYLAYKKSTRFALIPHIY